MFQPVKKFITLLGVLVGLLFLNGQMAAANMVTPDSWEVQNAIRGAVSYLDRELQAPGYDGMLEWAMLGFYGVGEVVEHLSALEKRRLSRV